MRRAATLFLVVLLVSTQTPVGQFFKLPVLLEHFLKHQQQEGTSLRGFLAEHYTSNHQDADLPEDEQLPFKNVTFYSLGYAVMVPLMQATVLTTLPVEKKVAVPAIYTPQQHLDSIFHPPRV